MKLNYKHTIYACFTGYIVQAIINNFAPLLFLTFQTSFNVSLDKIALLVSFNFGVQLIVDAMAPPFLKKLGYRIGIVTAHLFAAFGLIMMAVLPSLLPHPFIGLLISVVFYAIGGGLIEVLISPMVEACPTDHKESMMSLLHSFYCWGHVGVILVSTLFFFGFGIQNWPILSLIWAIVPLLNAMLLTRVPIMSIEESTGEETTFNQLIQNKVFWLMILIMICAGASELSVSQWASAFVEKGLGVNKTIGDLAGPMTFAILMGISRVLYSKMSHKVKLEQTMLVSGVLCLISYLVISLSQQPLLGLIGCALCGFSVGILWPGAFSLASLNIVGGGTMMFALLALAGDLGAAFGPGIVGFTSERLGDNLNLGILSAIVFPILLVIILIMNQKHLNQKND